MMNDQILLNPITNHVIESLFKCRDEMLIAVPFISSFAKSILTTDRLAKIKRKRIITCFDENNLFSFELDTLKYLIENDVEMVFNNSIHLKLYLFDTEGIITSSNLTRNGFEDNIELTSTIQLSNIDKCKSFFNHLWAQSKDNQINLNLIEECYPKYLQLKRRTSYIKKEKLAFDTMEAEITNFNLNDVIDFLFAADQDFTKITNGVYEANKERNRIKKEISNKFSVEDFYVAQNHRLRKQTIHYQIVHGEERKISGSGLRESHFKEVSENKNFHELMSYIFPPIIGNPDWNLDQEDVFREYCNGIFDFEIPQYSETMPIRLASYFYPEYFLPIFKLDHLEQICTTLGLKADCKTKGDRLFAFNLFLRDTMISIPYDNYVKMNIGYQLFFIIEIKNGLANGKRIEQILDENKQKWKKGFLIEGKKIIDEFSIDNVVS